MEFDSNFWVLLSFLLFVGLLLYFRVPAMALAALDKRAAGIDRELREAKHLRHEAQNMLAAWRRRQKEAESERADILSQAEAEAERLAEESRAAMSRHAERQAALAEARIRQSAARAEAEMRALAVETAVEAARLILRDARLGFPQSTSLEAEFRPLVEAVVSGRATRAS